MSGGARRARRGGAARPAGAHAGLPALVTGRPGRAVRPAGRGGAAGSAQAASRAVTCPPSSTWTWRSAPASSRAASPARWRARPAAVAAGPAGPVAGLADDQQRLAGEHVPLGGQALQERGVLQRGLLQGRVRQGRGGLAQRRDGGGQVGPPGPDQDLHRAGERVQPPAVGGGEGVLLGGAAQREVDRADTAATAAAPALPRPITPSGAMCRHSGASTAGGGGWRAGRGGPGGRGGDALGGGDQAARGAPLPPGGQQEPVQRQAVPLADDQGDGGQADRGGERGERGQRHHVPGGLEARPDDHRGDRGDGDLAGGQPGEDLVRALDVGGDGHGVGDLVAHGVLPFGLLPDEPLLPLVLLPSCRPWGACRGAAAGRCGTRRRR